MKAEILHGDCRELIAAMPDNSVDSIVTDPPYELGFMGKAWDSTGIAYDPMLWAECLRVLKPGGHLLAFGGSRTYHRLACAVEDAGFEIRDQIMWVYGSGFPKSLNVSIAIDKAAGVMGHRGVRFENSGLRRQGEDVPNPTGMEAHEPITPEAAAWEGWGTALKPAHEPIVVARKPLTGTVAANVLEYGTGAINIDGCRVPSNDTIPPMGGKSVLGETSDGYDRPWKHDPIKVAEREQRALEAIAKANEVGRWPANFIHNGSDEVTELMGSAARFFYCAKASKAERNAGSNNPHPTVKPLALMRYLIRLVTPPGGTVLEPFAGSGTTLVAAILEGFNTVGCELTAEYLPIIEGRVAWAEHQTPATLFDMDD